jgi:hypothetical protein
MADSIFTEFHLSAFAKHYEKLSDTFIETRNASDSLKRLITPGDTIFEIGIGTGYFASHFCNDGYALCGIQPKDQMLVYLKNNHPDINVLAEKKLEDYRFERE